MCIVSLHAYLKAAWMNVQHRLIQELMFYKFQLSYKIVEATKNTYKTKDEGAVDHRTVTKWLKKFHSGCKSQDDQTKSDGPKIGF